MIISCIGEHSGLIYIYILHIYIVEHLPINNKASELVNEQKQSICGQLQVNLFKNKICMYP